AGVAVGAECLAELGDGVASGLAGQQRGPLADHGAADGSAGAPVAGVDVAAHHGDVAGPRTAVVFGVQRGGLGAVGLERGAGLDETAEVVLGPTLLVVSQGSGGQLGAHGLRGLLVGGRPLLAVAGDLPSSLAVDDVQGVHDAGDLGDRLGVAPVGLGQAGVDLDGGGGGEVLDRCGGHGNDFIRANPVRQ